MKEELIKKIGLTLTDFDEEIKSEGHLIELITSSGLLYRKAIQYLILRDLRAYFNNPQLNYSDGIIQYFKFFGRGKKWKEFSNYIQFKVPPLKTSNIAKLLMSIFLVVYGYFILKVASLSTDLFVHAVISGLSIGGIVSLGALIPLALIYAYGQTKLPVKNIEDLVDKIIQQNIGDLLSDDKAKLKQILRNEIHSELTVK